MTETEQYIRVPKQMIKSVKHGQTLLAYGLIYLRTHGGNLQRKKLTDTKFRNVGISPNSIPKIKKELVEKCGVSISGDNLYSIDKNSSKHFKYTHGDKFTEKDYYVDNIPARFMASFADADIKIYYLVLRAYTSVKTKRIQASRSTITKEVTCVSRTKLWRMMNDEFSMHEIVNMPFDGMYERYGEEFHYDMLEDRFSRPFREFMNDKGLMNRSLIPENQRRLSTKDSYEDIVQQKPPKSDKPKNKSHIDRSRFKGTTKWQLIRQSKSDARNNFKPITVTMKNDGTLSYFDRSKFR